ncbi:DUF2764 family protein [Chlamydiifrater volucris]|uniref:DUF2764 family protein n=1 Tax=Chlamydiifrater volucris TaxID=2681470 RepID=UPI001BCD0FAC|nr:DUF2764 family protein [Chlamydiifrater volucris]
MTKYYFLSSFMPVQSPDGEAVFSLADLDDLLVTNLSREDWVKYQLIKRLFDLENFAFFWNGKEIRHSFGEVTKENVGDLLRFEQWGANEEFEDFFKDFLQMYKSSEERLQSYSQLVRDFLVHYSERCDGFLSKYLSFKQNLRIVLAGYRARAMQLDMSYVLRNEDHSDPIVLHTLMQKDAPQYELPWEFRDLKASLEDYGRLSHTLYRSLELYEFYKLEELMRDYYFDSGLVLGRAVSYLLALKRSRASIEIGKNFIGEMEKSLTW